MDGTKGFLIGCNYWASHAGIYMWRNWDESVVADDLKKLAGCGITHLRVFPLWPDFQPLTRYVNSGIGREMRIRDNPLDRSPEGIAGVDPVMISRFSRFTELCEQYGMKLLVCLINGWMSGRMFYPQAFQNTNIILNKTAVKWEIRFVKYFVNRFKNCKAIVAWEPGNETNVLRGVEEQPIQDDEYYVWFSCLVNAIRSVDATRPVISGIHGLSMQGPVSPSDIGEICDVTTVHPYPAFVPHCFVDGLDSMKSRLHSTAESVFYSDLGGVPCLCEEIGTLGNMLGGENTAANYIRASAYSLWAHDSTGIMWWCGFDQNHLDFPPYDWCGVERELGLFRADGNKKQVAEVFCDIRSFHESTEQLPARDRHAVCILTRDQDQWGVAYSSFVLAKQAGFELRFADGEYEIPEAPVYMLPSLCSDGPPRRTLNALLKRVEEGAVLYISVNNVFLSGIETYIGGYIKSNSLRTAETTVQFMDKDLNLSLYGERAYRIVSQTSDVLAVDSDGNPALLCTKLGNGCIYFLGFAPEQYLCRQPDAFACGSGKEYYKLYQKILKPHIHSVVTEKSSPFIGITEHSLGHDRYCITAINYSDEPITAVLSINKQLSGVRCGNVRSIDNGKAEIILAVGEMAIFETM